MSLVFLEELFSAYPPDDSFCEIRSILPGRVKEPAICRFFGMTDLHKSHAHAKTMMQTHDVYVGVLPRARRSGNDHDINTGAWLWVDIDRGKATDTEMREFLEHVKHKLPAPRMVVLSGSGGTHLYWRLSEVVTMETAEERKNYSDMLKRLVLAVGEGSSGIRADKSCTNVSRILRLPHTLNHKHDPPKPVEAVLCAAEGYLSLAEWDALLPWPPMPAWKTRPKLTRTASSRSGTPPGLIAWAERGYPEGNRHFDIVGAAAFLRRDTDLSEDAAFELLQLKAQNSPGRRMLTDAELESAWNWAGR